MGEGTPRRTGMPTRRSTGCRSFCDPSLQSWQRVEALAAGPGARDRQRSARRIPPELALDASGSAEWTRQAARFQRARHAQSAAAAPPASFSEAPRNFWAPRDACARRPSRPTTAASRLAMSHGSALLGERDDPQAHRSPGSHRRMRWSSGSSYSLDVPDRIP